ncbi:MAG: hypothetical protein PHP54_00880 [Clostridia bacterium]|nr:hypothetical protein [Clostridia bacterium]
MNKTNVKYGILIVMCMVLMIGSYMVKEALYAGTNEPKVVSFERYLNRIQEIESMYANRYVAVLKEEKQILIGNNKNEVENGYYDIRIDGSSNYSLYINKLYKEKFNKDKLIDEIYLEELLNSVNNLFDMKLKEESICLLKEKIYTKYEALRKVENVDTTSQKAEEEIITVQNFNLTVNYVENMLKIEINEV